MKPYNYLLGGSGRGSHMPDQARLTATEEATLIAALECALLVAAKARSVPGEIGEMESGRYEIPIAGEWSLEDRDRAIRAPL